jgi:hypothetical protein
MNPDVRRKWVTALKSGKYVKCTSRMHAVVNGTHQFCALGVLCDIAEKEGITRITHTVDLGDGMHSVAYDDHFTMLPRKVMAWAGLDKQMPTILFRDDDGDQQIISVAQMNDALMLSFNEIAELIDAYFGALEETQITP